MKKIIFTIVIIIQFTVFNLSFAQTVHYYQTGEEFSGPFASWKNVKTDFGAMGDGVTNDAPAINAALLAMKNTQTNNYNVLYFPSGTYLISDTLYNVGRVLGDDYSGMAIIGEDPATTIIKWNGAAFGTMFYINGWYMRVSRLTFDGNSTAMRGIFHTGGFSTGCEWSDLVFTNFNPVYSVGLDFGAPVNGQAENAVLRCAFTGVKYGIASCNWNSLDQWIWNCLFEDCHVAINQCIGFCQIYGNVFLRSQWYDISGSPYKNVMVNNTSINSASFLLTQDGYLRGNKIYSNVTDSFHTSPGSVMLDNIIRCPNNIWPIARMRNGSNMIIGNTISKAQTIWKDWPVQPPFMPFDHGIGGSYNVNKEIEKSIDNNPATSFASQANFGGIKWNCPQGTKRTVVKYTVSAPPNAGGKSPGNFNLYGSNDWGYTWNLLDSEINQIFNGGGNPVIYNISNTTPYSIYELKQTVNNASGWIEINEFHLFDSLNSDLTADSAGLLTGADEDWGTYYPLDNNIVDSSAIVVPDTVFLPGTPINFQRTIFEVIQNTGDDGLAIQTEIDSAATMPFGTKPVVHIANGIYNILHTIIVPSGSDMQIIGDGVGSGTITRLLWAGDTIGPLMKCLGPSRVTMKDLLLRIPYDSYVGPEALVVENADQVGGRIFGNQFHAGGADGTRLGDVGIFSDEIENSDITIICGGPGCCMNGAIKAKGGPVLSSGGNTNGQISCLSGASGNSQNLYSVTDGGRVDAEGMWYEGDIANRTSGLVDLENCSGKLSLACMAWYMNSPLPIIHTNNFTGSLTLLLNHINHVPQAICLMEGSGTNFSVFGGYNDWGQSDTIGGSADSTWQDLTSPNSSAVFLSNTGTTNLHRLDDVINKVHNLLPDSSTILNDLAQLRATRTDPPMDMIPGVTDVKLFRVTALGTSQNAAAHFNTVGNTTEVNSIVSNGNFQLTIYPNPNSGEFTIKFSTKPTSTIQIELTDEIGKVVKKFETKNETIVIKESNLEKGIYCLTARNNDEVVIKKINVVK